MSADGGSRVDRLDFEFVDFHALAGKTPPPREWVIEPWLPRKTVTLLAGGGGVGKSLLAQQLCTSIAGNIDWLGQSKRGAVIGLFCEDDHDELWRRQADICRSMDADMDGLSRWLKLDGRAGRFNTLTYFGDHGVIEDSPLLISLRTMLEDYELEGLQLLVLDNVAQMFNGGSDGAESDRGKVTAFVNHLTGLAINHNMAVLLLAHPAKAEGSEFSGSTAWENAVRSRLFLRRESDDPNSRVILSRRKANYASRGGDVPFVWVEGAFRRTDGKKSMTDMLQELSRKDQVEDAVLAALDWLMDRNLAASHKKQAGNYLPREMKKRGLDGGFSSAEIAEAMDTLIGEKRIEADAQLWEDKHRNKTRGLKPATDTQQGTA